MANLDTFLNSFKFDYLETYSFQVGEKYELHLKTIKDELEILKKELEKPAFGFLRKEKRFYELEKNLKKAEGGQNSIIENGEFHLTSTLIKALSKEDKIWIKFIDEIYKSEQQNKVTPVSGCIPFYRDAIVFYKNNEIIEILDICFECAMIRNNNQNSIFANFNSFFILHKLLKS